MQLYVVLSEIKNKKKTIAIKKKNIIFIKKKTVEKCSVEN